MLGVDNTTAERLLSFLRAYTPAINAELQRRDLPELVNHRASTDLVVTFLCSNGAAET